VDFLHKPLDIHAVKSKVNVFVDLYRQSKAMKQQVEALEQSRREQEAAAQALAEYPAGVGAGRAHAR
jgi:AmiR/NasT family two-component response regulator